jgi:cytochrome P450
MQPTDQAFHIGRGILQIRRRLSTALNIFKDAPAFIPNLHNQHGDFVYLHMPRVDDIFLVLDPDIIRAVFQSPTDKGSSAYRIVSNFAGAPITATIKEHTLWVGQRRHTEVGYEVGTDEITKRVAASQAQKLRDRVYTSQGKPFDYGVLQDVTFDMIVEIMCDQPDLPAEHKKAIIDAMEYLISYVGKAVILGETFVWLWKGRELAAIRKRAYEAIDYMIKVNNGRKNKALATMIDGFQKLVSANIFTIKRLQSELFFAFSAGSETTEKLLAGLKYLLAKYPHIQKRLRESIAACIVDGELDEELIYKNRFLSHVIRTYLRIYPPTPLMTRTLAKDMVIGGVTYPKGTPISTWLPSAQCKPFGKYTDLWEFNPDLYDDPEFSKGVLDLAWGGSRPCAGRKIAWAEVMRIITEIVWYFEIRLVNPGAADAKFVYNVTYGLDEQDPNGFVYFVPHESVAV